MAYVMIGQLFCAVQIWNTFLVHGLELVRKSWVTRRWSQGEVLKIPLNDHFFCTKSFCTLHNIPTGLFPLKQRQV